MKSRTVFEASGSKFAVAHPETSTWGSWISARAMAIFCLVPFENVRLRRLGAPKFPTASGDVQCFPGVSLRDLVEFSVKIKVSVCA